MLDRLRSKTGKNRSSINSNPDILFIGGVSENGFQVTRRLDRPENFMPQIKGTIRPIAEGCLLSIRYTLQFSSRMFVVFWTVTTLFFALFLWFIQTDMKLGLIALGALVFNIAITHINFYRQYKKSRIVLIDVLLMESN